MDRRVDGYMVVGPRSLKFFVIVAESMDTMMMMMVLMVTMTMTVTMTMMMMTMTMTMTTMTMMMMMMLTKSTCNTCRVIFILKSFH